jgi:hypothetical protein
MQSVPGRCTQDFNKKVMAQRCVSFGIIEEEMGERIRKAVPLGRWGEPKGISSGAWPISAIRAQRG